MINQIKKSINESIEVKKMLMEKSFLNSIQKAIKLMVKILKEGKKILIAGNGGSAADAQHFAAELMGKFQKTRRAWPVISLTTDASFLTAWSNDVDFETVFSRQIEGLGEKGDLFIGISTSGNSKNIIEAVKVAKNIDMKIILLLGGNGGKLKNMGEIELMVSSKKTPRIQESHILILHILCEMIESELLNQGG